MDDEIRRTYADRSSATNKNSLYDSYIRAIKWASLRIQERGVIAYVCNGGWLDNNTMDGMRKSLADEFTSIYVYNLRGNGRIAGEEGRKEGRPLFEFGGWRSDGTEIKNTEGGSRATIAIVVFVKDPARTGRATIKYAQVDDYLSAGQKIRAIEDAQSVYGLATREITPNDHGDWINQRRDDFGTFLSIEDVFGDFGRGIETARDAWNYNSSAQTLAASIRLSIATFEQNSGRTDGDLDNDTKRISWSRSLRKLATQGKHISFDASRVRNAQYRPFFQQRTYVDPALTNIVGVASRVFPLPSSPNEGIYQVGNGSDVPFSVLMSTKTVDLHLTGAGSGGQFFARWRYDRVEGDDMLSFDEGEVIDGYRKIDNITDHALRKFIATYKDESITKDDIFFYVYGLLHSQEYRDAYAADLKKMLPRIPFVREFRTFVDAGRALSNLHVSYENADPYPLTGLDVAPLSNADAFDFYAVEKTKFGGKGKEKDKSTIVYNRDITITGIPEGAYRYMIGSRSAIEWLMDRYQVKVDSASGIKNDPNDWSREVNDPRYILDLFARIVTVSLETMKLVDALPPLDILTTE